jgi:hypothetical protein
MIAYSPLIPRSPSGRPPRATRARASLSPISGAGSRALYLAGLSALLLRAADPARQPVAPERRKAAA